MSEYSESYHLRTENAQEVVRLLEHAGINGYVFRPENGWVAFVADTESTFEPDPRLAAATRQLLVHYVYTEDHGCSFAVYENSQETCAYRCDWDGDLEIHDAKLNLAVLDPLVRSAGRTTISELDTVLHPENGDAVMDLEIGYRFAEAIGLTNYTWVDYAHIDKEPLPELAVVKPIPAPPKPAVFVPTPKKRPPLSPKFIASFLMFIALGIASTALIALRIWDAPQMKITHLQMGLFSLTSIPLFIVAMGFWKLRRWAIVALAALFLVIGGMMLFDTWGTAGTFQNVKLILFIILAEGYFLSLLPQSTELG